ncbi:MAG: hypothetical protein AAF558_13015 [Verrucomicrobiota bacterium]
MSDEHVISNLEPPGAGLPPFQGFMAKHFLFPFFCGFYNWSRAMELYKVESDRILDLSVHLHPEDLTRKILVPRLAGLEDSSRYWSVSMTLEHLMIVGESVKTTIIMLSHDEIPPGKADTAAVKPQGIYGPEVIEKFRSFVDEYCWEIQEKAKKRRTKRTYDHPWFGPLTARRWVRMGALHQKLHRSQIEHIVIKLKSSHQNS